MALRAIYEKGQLRLIGNEKPSEGQEFVLIPADAASNRAKVRAALGDLLIDPDEFELLDDETISDETLAKEVEDAFSGFPSLSQIVIEDREAGY